MNIELGRPSRTQAEFLRATAAVVAFGGSRGGGKSYAVRLKIKLMALEYPGIRMLLVRRTYSDLDENHIKPLIAETAGWAKYKYSDRSMTFFNGSFLKFGYCDSESDLRQYQGREYDLIFIDEATQFTEDMYTQISATNRGANSFPKRIYLTCNPGGVGMGWVKRLFIDRDYRDGENPDDYVFIRSSVYDNKILLREDPAYLQRLLALPDDLRRAWLDGDWDIYQGQYFSEFRRSIHVMRPFEIPENWNRLIAIDYGLDMLAVVWGAFDERGHGYIYKEYCCPELNAAEAARAIIDRCEEREKTADGRVHVIAPPDLWARTKDTGKSIEEIFWENGCLFDKADANRQSGWMNIKDWLMVSPDECGENVSGVRIFENCTELIRCLPLLQYSKRNSLDCDTEPHSITHICDAFRYLLADRPKRAEPIEALTAEQKMLAENKRRAMGYGIAKKRRIIR